MDNQPSDTGPDQPGRHRPAPRGTAAYPRRRGNTACQVCRARRTKCEGGTPCKFCLRTGATCIRSAVDLSSFDPASIQILERIETLASDFREFRDELSQYDRFAGHDPGAANVPSFSPSADVAWASPPSAEDALMQNANRPHLLAILKTGHGGTPGTLSVGSPASSFADFDPQSVNLLTEKFFEYVHVKNPVLDERTTKQLVSRFVLHGVDWSAPSCLVLLVCALGALATPLGPSHGTAPGSSAYSNSYSYFVAAQKRLGSCLVEGGLMQAQCLFLAGVYLMTIFRPLEAWRMFSQALSCCQDFAFLTETNTTEVGISNSAWSDNMVSEQAVYWSAWKSEQENRWEVRPPDFCTQSLQQVEFPKFFPTPPAPAETDTGRQARGWTFYLTEISLRRQALMLMAELSDTAKQPRHRAISRMMTMLPARMAQIDDWLNKIPPPMSLNTPPEADDICKFVLRGHVLNFYEMLHWPFLGHFIASLDDSGVWLDQSATFDRDEQSQLKMLAETALMYHVERIRVNRPGFFHRHHGTWFLIRSCSRSATNLLRSILYNNKCSDEDKRLNMPTGWQDAITEVIELHQYWKMEVPDTAFRLNLLESLLAHSEST